MADMAKIFIFIGGVMMAIGVALYFFGKIPGFGKFPGDIFIKKENFTFYFPVTTSILISIILSLVLMLWNKR